MIVPPEWPRPEKGRLKARCQVGFLGGAWCVYDHTGFIRSNYADAFRASQHVHGHNLNRY